MTLERLRELKRRSSEADLEFRRAVAQAHAEGYSLREIANAIGVSHQTVANMIQSLDR